MELKHYDKKYFSRLKPLIDDYHVEVGDELADDFYNKNNLKQKFDTLIIFDDNELIGFAIGERLSVGYLLLDIYVVKNARRSGIALMLVKELLHLAGKCRVLSNPIKKESLNLLVKLGFKRLPEKEQKTSKTSSPPYYTHYKDF